ncbi:hypothetical protein A9Q99_17965 [Gammaproteobacteria bacterium 45_16_T64]|nr:hypothetical protein A9Q99_17965 [Gammaproteobacteria bacterium 45_16_T64]
MQWVSNLYKGMATPIHAAIGILGVCIVAFSFAGALGGFMEKFTYAVFFLYGIFLFYCAFFSRLLVEADRLEDDDPKRGNLIGLSYVYQGVLIPVILVMTWWILSTFSGEATNLIVTAKKISKPLISEFEHMTMGPISYDEDKLSDGEGTITLELSGFLNLDKPLNSMIEYSGVGRAVLNMSVPSGLRSATGYEIFADESLVELELDRNNSTSDRRPYKDACYVRIPVLKPDLSNIPITEIPIYDYHKVTLRLLRGVNIAASNGMNSDEILVGDGFVMVKYEDHRAYTPNGSVIYCSEPVERNGKEYFNISIGNSIPVEIYASFIYPVISSDLIAFSRDSRSYLRSWKRYQYYLKRGFERIFD